MQVIRRRRTVQQDKLSTRLDQMAERLSCDVTKARSDVERNELLRKLRLCRYAADMNEWLVTRGARLSD